MSMTVSFCAVLFHTRCLGWILNLIESVSEGFPSYSLPGRPTIWMIVGQGPIALAVRAGGGCLDIFTLRYLFSSFSLSLGGGPI